MRVDSVFFADLDAQLGDGRGPRGEPSSTDFLLIDLPTIVDEFAEDFESIPALFPEREDYRILVTSGRLVAASSVIGQLVDAETVVLLGIDIDLHHPPE